MVTMLVTVYKLTYPGMEKVNEYYRWQLEWPKRDSESTHNLKVDCPGCGKKLSYQAVTRLGHQCPGTLTAHPVQPLARGIRGPNTKTLHQERFREYLRKSKHPVQFTE